jgi:pectate lyase
VVGGERYTMAVGDGRSGRLVGAGLGFALAALLLAGCTPDADGGAGQDATKACGGKLPVFPGAEGFGCGTPGGRGGQVITVTNLNDAGAGSLRAALESGGRRFVVFEVSGTIDVREQIVVDDPYLTVAGQTAPGGGITLKAADGNVSGLIDIRTHDVVIRYMRFRTGAPPSVTGENLDGVNIWEDGHDVVIDHDSFSWAVDENVSTWDGAHDITFSWNIIAQGLRESTHPDGEHSKGLLVSGDATENISVHHNLFAHNTARNPQVTSPGLIQVVNNVIYDYGDSRSSATTSRQVPTATRSGTRSTRTPSRTAASGACTSRTTSDRTAQPRAPRATWSHPRTAASSWRTRPRACRRSPPRARTRRSRTC